METFYNYKDFAVIQIDLTFTAVTTEICGEKNFPGCFIGFPFSVLDFMTNNVKFVSDNGVYNWHS